jgi:hypothetical protein
MEPVSFLLFVGIGVAAFLIYKSGHAAGFMAAVKQYVLQGAQVEAPTVKSELASLRAHISAEIDKLRGKQAAPAVPAAPAPIDASVTTAQSAPK